MACNKSLQERAELVDDEGGDPVLVLVKELLDVLLLQVRVQGRLALPQADDVDLNCTIQKNLFFMVFYGVIV